MVPTIENLRNRQAELRWADGPFNFASERATAAVLQSLGSNQRKKTCAESSTWIADFLRAPVRTL
jgi:hypothetical protein